MLGTSNDNQNLSFMRNINVVAKKWPEMVPRWAFMTHTFSVTFLTKMKKIGNEKIVF
jgi:hypothetical protein